MRTKLEHIETAKEIALKNKGICLSSSCIGVNTKLLWRCNNNHQWLSTLRCIKLGSWCPDCARAKSKTPIELLKKKAKTHGGQLISLEFKNKENKMEWECVKGHRWFAKWNHVKDGSWCPFCAKVARVSFNDAIMLASNNNGKLTSSPEAFINNRSKLNWECNLGHKWKATYSNVSQGTWCPDCQIGKTERFCREVLESLFKKPFPKIRPNWLIGPKGYALELDGYNAELNIAFEYNGSQHYEVVYKGQDLEYQKQKDDLKLKICEQKGIRLIVIEEIRYPTKNIVKKIIENKVISLGLNKEER